VEGRTPQTNGLFAKERRVIAVIEDAHEAGMEDESELKARLSDTRLINVDQGEGRVPIRRLFCSWTAVSREIWLQASGRLPFIAFPSMERLERAERYLREEGREPESVL
jgi:hypothetical protein